MTKKKSRRAPKFRWDKDAKSREEIKKPLYIIFVVGGITFSEIRLIYSIPNFKEKNIIIGSTDILDPARFIKGLANLSHSEYIKAIKNSEGNAISDHDIANGYNSEFEDDGPAIDDEDSIPQMQILPKNGKEDCCSCLDACQFWRAVHPGYHPAEGTVV